ncbi:MAG: TlpA family protein disulfide reductase [Pyrinomonadaceae bacterium]|nr:TlpA family protein disulfide reductase [Pyrinomonadaceae bacterium]
MMFNKHFRLLSGFALALSLIFSQLSFAAPSITAMADGLDFSFRAVDGRDVSAESLRGDVVVLAFGASWLPLSRTQVQGVQQLADEYAGRKLQVYWVSTDSESPKSRNYATDDQLRSFARKNGLKVTMLRDPEGEVFKRLGVDGNQLPAVVILDRQGNVSGEPIGGLDPEGNLVRQLKERLSALL